VYLAVDSNRNQPVVVTRIRDEMASTDEFRNRVFATAGAMAAIDHKNVVRLETIVSTQNGLFLVSEYVHGMVLSDLIRSYAKQGIPVPLELAFGLFSGILAGVHAAGMAGVVHGGIDPTSILVDSSNTVAKVDNFGIERAIDDIFRDRAMYRSGEAHKYMSYMAPERLVCDRNLGGRADIYSLGVLLFVILTNRSPFPTETLLKSEVSTDWRIPSLAHLRPDVAPHVRSVIAKACARDRASRFGSVVEMAAALRGETDVSGTASATSQRAPVASVSTSSSPELEEIDCEPEELDPW